MPRTTAVTQVSTDPMRPEMGLKQTRAVTKATHAAQASATASAKRVPDQLPAPVSTHTPVQSAKRPNGPCWNIRRRAAFTETAAAATAAAAAAAAAARSPAAPSATTGALEDLITAALTEEPEGEEHCGSTFNQGTNLHLRAPDKDGTFPAVDKDRFPGQRSGTSTTRT